MQSLKYREILHAVAYKLGYDPLDPNFPRDEAVAIGTYIDQWVTRLYPAQDWPEWTRIHRFQPDANHIVNWTQLSPDTAHPPSVVLSTLTMWRILAVYIVDPRLVYGANSTKFYLREEGIHCGFEHGVNVWIKYIDPPPRYTSVEWDPSVVYRKDEVVYSISTGEVYKNKVNSNLNHDPSTGASIGGGGGGGNDRHDGGSTFVQTDVLQDKAISQFGTPTVNKIMKVSIGTLAIPSIAPIPDPPAAASVFIVNVMDSTGLILAVGSAFGDGVVTLSGITTDIATQLSVALGGGWTVTPDTVGFTITIENASDFQLINTSTGQDWPQYFANGTASAQPLLYVQIQAYVAASSNAVITPQIIKTTFSADQLIAGALYGFTFKDLAGNDHVLEYQSQTGDGQDQIMQGILDAIPNTALTDNYFEKVQVSADQTPSTTFTIDDHASLNATITLPGSAWWEIVPFPLALAESVIRGAFADALMDWGQADKQAMQEQKVPTEVQAAADKFTYSPVLPLTGQNSPKGRYKL